MNIVKLLEYDKYGDIIVSALFLNALKIVTQVSRKSMMEYRCTILEYRPGARGMEAEDIMDWGINTLQQDKKIQTFICLLHHLNDMIKPL